MDGLDYLTLHIPYPMPSHAIEPKTLLLCTGYTLLLGMVICRVLVQVGVGMRPKSEVGAPGTMATAWRLLGKRIQLLAGRLFPFRNRFHAEKKSIRTQVKTFSSSLLLLLLLLRTFFLPSSPPAIFSAYRHVPAWLGSISLSVTYEPQWWLPFPPSSAKPCAKRWM